MDEPGRAADRPRRAERPATYGLVHLLNPGYQPAERQAAQPARRAKFRWRHDAPPEHPAAEPPH
jgi:hypothetical protein